MQPTPVNPWPLGSNNTASPERLPEGFARELVNVDVSAQGVTTLRAKGELAVALDGMRHAVAAGRHLICACDAGLMAYDTDTGAASPIGDPLPPGRIAAAEHLGEAFICVVDTLLRCTGNGSRAWGRRQPAFSIEAVPGGMTGLVKVAVTAVGQEESGAQVQIIRLHDQAVQITSAESGVLRVYASQPDHETLYDQGVLVGSMTVNGVDDSGIRLTTAHKIPFPRSSMLASWRSQIVGADGPYVYLSEPMMPHLHDPVSGFIALEAPVTMLAPTEGGLFVATEHKTYFVSGLDGVEMSMREVLDLGAVENSGIRLPTGQAAWFTRYGQAVGSADGSIELLNRGNYSPELARQGAAGFISHNGNEIAVTTMRGPVQSNGLSVGDFSDLETGHD